MSKKEEFFKERFKQALDSTYKVISEELHNLSIIKISKTENGREIIGILTHLVDSTQNDTFQD